MPGWTQTEGDVAQQMMVTDGALLSDAADLIARYGAYAAAEAAARADRSRSLGNVVHFCRWRQIGLAIDLLSDDAAAGTIH